MSTAASLALAPVHVDDLWLPVGMGLGVALFASLAAVHVGRLRRRAAALRQAAVLSPYQVASQAAAGPVLCEMPGAAAAGPGGPLTAPLSGTRCVWYHVRVCERRQFGYDDTRLLFRGARALRTDATFEPIREESSAAPFAVVDRNTRALVNPQGMVADFVYPAGVNTDTVPAPRSFYRYEPLDHQTGLADVAAAVLAPSLRSYVIGHLYEEWCLTEGMPVFVLGQARADRGSVEVSQPFDGPFVLSVSPPQQQVARASMRVGWFPYVAAVLAFVFAAVTMALALRFAG